MSAGYRPTDDSALTWADADPEDWDKINPDLLRSTPVNDIGQSEEPAELCTRDGSPCWVEGDDAHWRCGTVQCGSKMAGDVER